MQADVNSWQTHVRNKLILKCLDRGHENIAHTPVPASYRAARTRMPAKVDLVAGSSGVAARDMNRAPIWETRATQKTRARIALAIEWLALIAGGRSP